MSEMAIRGHLDEPAIPPDLIRHWAMVQRDRAFVQAFWNLHQANVWRHAQWVCDAETVPVRCPLRQTARRLGLAL
jgi:hypothetical protein